MNSNIDNILEYLKNLSISTSFSVVIPSNNTELTFKQLNTEQLKQILETIADNSAFNNNFNTVLYNIFKDNLITQNVDVNGLTIYDAQYIALQIRANSLSEKLIVYFTDEEVKSYQLPGDKHEINLKELINHKKLNHISDESILENNVTVTCKMPTIKDENDFIKYFTDNLNKFLDKQLQNVVGEIFLYEIVKSIRDVTINNTKTNFSELAFKDRVEIVKQLPTTLTGKVINFIEKYKQSLFDLYLVDIQTEVQGQTIILQKELQFNATLFNY